MGTSRLTKKKNINCLNYGGANCYLVNQEFYDKLGKLENIEQKLGTDLITLFDKDFIKMAKNYIEKKPFVYAPRKKLEK